VSNGREMSESELERMWKEAAIVKLHVLSQRLAGATGKETRKPCQDSRYPGGDLDEALTEYKRFPLSQHKCNITST
jgi:hypothetical protein